MEVVTERLLEDALWLSGSRYASLLGVPSVCTSCLLETRCRRFLAICDFERLLGL